MATRGEELSKLDWKVSSIVQQVVALRQTSLPRLQKLYYRYFGEDATGCTDARLLARKLGYLLQKRHFHYHDRKMTPVLKQQTEYILALPLVPEEEPPMAKKEKTKKVKEEELEDLDEDVIEDDEEEEEEEEEDDDSDSDDDDDEEEEDDEEEDEDSDEEDEDSDDDDEDDEDEDEDDDEEEAEEKPKKRSAPVRTGNDTVVKFAGEKFKVKFVYEAIVALLAANQKAKQTDKAIAESIRKAFPGVNYEDYRVNADRKKYNKGMFKNQNAKEPKILSTEFNEKGKVRVREIPEQLKKYVKPGQPVAKTIAENKKKGLIKKSKKA